MSTVIQCIHPSRVYAANARCAANIPHDVLRLFFANLMILKAKKTDREWRGLFGVGNYVIRNNCQSA